MPRPRDPNRDRAFEIYKKHKGEIDLIEIADQLQVSAGTVRGWKSKDKWNEKLIGTFQTNTERSKRKKRENNKALVDEVNQVMDNPELTDEQRLFCIYFAKSLNATRSYQKAYGCSYASAMTSASALLRIPKVAAEVRRLKKERLTQAFLEPEDIFQKYMDIAFADLADYLSWGQEEVPVIGMYGPVEVKDPETGEKTILKQNVNVIRLREETEADTSLIGEIKQGRDGISIKLPDRMKALQWLSDHMDLATPEQKEKTEKLKAEIERIKADTELIKIKADTGSDEDIADDGFLEALKATAGEDWADEEAEETTV